LALLPPRFPARRDCRTMPRYMQPACQSTLTPCPPVGPCRPERPTIPPPRHRGIRSGWHAPCIMCRRLSPSAAICVTPAGHPGDRATPPPHHLTRTPPPDRAPPTGPPGKGGGGKKINSSPPYTSHSPTFPPSKFSIPDYPLVMCPGYVKRDRPAALSLASPRGSGDDGASGNGVIRRWAIH
jgi:hypothetical protein